MATRIEEFFGFRATDRSLLAEDHVNGRQCPFIGGTCTKTLSDRVISGVCTLRPATSDPVICCPNRLYANNYQILKDVAEIAFGSGYTLEPGPAAARLAAQGDATSIGVFGKRWGGELRLPQRIGRGGFFVDWILARFDSSGSALEFVAVEVQSIDTTGNYRGARESLIRDQQIVQATAGFNWENVNKRIIPQLLYKGNVLQRERLCLKGLFFVTPTPVYDRVIDRVGGPGALLTYPLQSSSITFLSYGLDSGSWVEGAPVPLKLENQFTTNIGQLAAAFAGPGVMPPQNVYEQAINEAVAP